jgi:hypothetical protein
MRGGGSDIGRSISLNTEQAAVCTRMSANNKLTHGSNALRTGRSRNLPTSSPAYCFRHRKNLASMTPNFRHISPTTVPRSAWRNAWRTCAGVTRLLLIGPPARHPGPVITMQSRHNASQAGPVFQSGIVFGKWRPPNPGWITGPLVQLMRFRRSQPRQHAISDFYSGGGPNRFDSGSLPRNKSTRPAIGTKSQNPE